jgi:hypothetical protein
MISDILGRDLTSNGMAVFALLFILLLVIMNPEGEKTEEDTTPPGQVIIELRWPDKINADVDLWAKAPNQRPVGYSNKSGQTLDLLRDDLGQVGDPMDLNFEFIYGRNVPEGQWCINVHLFRGSAPIPITVRMSIKRGTSQPSLVFLLKDELIQEGQELTIYCFILDKLGRATNKTRLSVPLREDTSE